jgi:ABC-type glycerol-3-phosphate transport system permease component
LSSLVVLPASLLTLFAIVMVVAVVALVAWALELMQAANDRREFSLMLAGCMVCSAAVGLATVMVLTLTGANRLEARGLLPPIPQLESGVSLDAIVLPRQGPPQSRPGSPE